MTTIERERLRIAILQQLSQVGEIGLQLNQLNVGARLAGFQDVTLPELASEIFYLIDKDLCCSVTKMLSPENKRWRITAAGRDQLAEIGLG